jgi:hypothetical protein
VTQLPDILRMFRRLLGNSGSGSGSTRDKGRVASRGNSRFGRKKNEISDGGSANRMGVIRNDMEEEHFASGVSKEKVAMSDKLDSHKGGTMFKYAVIGSAPSDERTGIISRLRTYKAPSRVNNMNISEIPAIRLFGDAVEFPMTDALRMSGSGGKEDYCLIDSVLIHFVPLDSFLNDKTVITIQLNDFRKISGTAVRVARVDNTMTYNLLFSLDYCVETRDLDKMTLSFACPQKDFQEGVSWGAVKVVAQVAFMSFPKRLPVIETLAVAIFADTDLMDYQWDPREMDAVLTPQAIKGLKEANGRGEVENLTLPKDDKVGYSAARTIMGITPENSSPGEAITAMKEAALKVRREAEVRNPLRSALRKRPIEDVDSPVFENPHDDGITPDDSQSRQGSVTSLSDVVEGDPKGKRIARFTG